MPTLNEIIVLRRHAFGAAVETRAAKPSICLFIIVQDGAALIQTKDFADVEAHALKAAVIHARGEPASCIPDRERL